jgi:Lhr-like helicase
MIKDEHGKLYHITEKEESNFKIKELLRNVSCNRGTINGSIIDNELYIIGETNGLYYTSSKYMLCRIEKRDNSKYDTSNIEETDFENLFSLLALNNLLKEPADVVQKIIDEKFEEYRAYLEKKGIYYELTFKNDCLTFLVEHHSNFTLYMELSNKTNSNSGDIYIEIPGMDVIHVNSYNYKRELREYVLKSGMDLLKDYTIHQVKNGVIINDEYFETLEEGFAILEERKKEKKEEERKTKKLIDFFERNDGQITTYSKDYKHIYIYKYDKEKEKFLFDNNEIKMDIVWNRLRDAGYDHSLF